MRRVFRSLGLAATWSLWAAAASAQTTTVQTPSGGTQTVTVQGDGTGQTMVFTQTVTGGDATAAPPAGAGGINVIQLAPGAGGAPAVPLPFAPRDATTPLPTGTSTIRGRVTAADSGRPLRRAVVRVAAPGVREARTVSTDQNGRWELKDLPAGSYTVSASRTGYVASGYRQARLTAPPRPVTVTDRETRERIDIALAPGGVIVGRIVDEFGEPVSDSMVSAQRLEFSGGVRRPVTAGPPSVSNDIGEFRIYGLSPGNYFLSAAPRMGSNPFDTPADRIGYGQTWYPAATDLGAAQRITVRAGDTVSGVVVTLSPARTARVTGTVLGADGRPARGGAVILTGSASPAFLGTNGVIRPDGTFTLNTVAPGAYTLRAAVGGPGGSPGFSTAEIVVNGTDIDGLILQPQVPATVAGRLVGAPDTLARIDPARVRLMAAPFGPQSLAAPPQPPQPLGADLTFSFAVTPGLVTIRPLALPGLIIRAVRLDGREVTRGFEVAPGAALTELEVEVTASTAKLVVSATDARGEAAPDHDLIVFPQDETKWGVPMPGHSSTGRTGEQGTFETPALLPGAYYVALADDIQLELGDSNDPEVLGTLRARAQRITVGDGETATVQLRISER